MWVFSWCVLCRCGVCIVCVHYMQIGGVCVLCACVECAYVYVVHMGYAYVYTVCVCCVHVRCVCVFVLCVVVRSNPLCDLNIFFIVWKTTPVQQCLWSTASLRASCLHFQGRLSRVKLLGNRAWPSSALPPSSVAQ